MYIICTYVNVYINIYTKYYVGVPSQAEYSLSLQGPRPIVC